MAKKSTQKSPKIAIVADWIYGGGAEKVVEQLHLLYPDAPIYTSYCSKEWQKRLDNKVITGYLNSAIFVYLRKFLPLLRQWWFARIDLSEYDLIISSSGNGESKFINKQGAIHLCYCHTPPHFYWRKYKDYLQNPGFGKANFLARLGLKLLVKPLRERDYQAAQKVDYFIANSNHIKKDIEKYYKRKSVVVHPPINVELFKAKPSGKLNKKNSYVVWGRHVPDKKLDIAIKACNDLGANLVVIGHGPETKNLQKIAGKTISFKGKLSERQLVKYAHSSKAFLFPSYEDFGISPVEAMAAGIPVIAYRRGGSQDFVVPQKTGLLFDNQSVNSLKNVLLRFDETKFDEAFISAQAEKFSSKKFRQKISLLVDKLQSPPPKARTRRQ